MFSSICLGDRKIDKENEDKIWDMVKDCTQTNHMVGISPLQRTKEAEDALVAVNLVNFHMYIVIDATKIGDQR